MISNDFNINYLSLEGLPWVISAWVFMILLRPFATFIHEIGHVIPAVLFTNNEVYIRVGQSNKSWQGRFGKLIWEISFFNSREGFTGYDKGSLGKHKLIVVILGGIISSFTMAFITGMQIFGNQLPIILEVVLVSWFCANCLVFIRSILPMRLKPTKAFPDGPPSDGLELKYIFLGKNY